MARGWESKNVESQMEEALQPRERHQPMSDEARSRVQQRATLELARQRVLHDLERATVPQHRAMLERALSDLEERLKSLAV
jgi:hypothetical protein